MTRSQAIILSGLLGLVMLVFLGLLVVFLVPADTFSTTEPTATLTPLPPPPIPTATLPNFMPIPGPETPVVEPTATNTRLPTATSTPVRTATPTVVITLNISRPSRTPTPSDTPVPPPPVVIEPPADEPTRPLSRQYGLTFEADETRIEAGDCTVLRWRVDGAMVIELDGKRVSRSDQERVCPDEDTTYELSAQLPDGISESRIVTVFVEE